MGAYFIRRVLIAIPVLIGITMAAFFVLSAAPGDPVLARLDPEVLARLTPADIEERRRALGLDQPAPIRYFIWLGDVLQGNLGFSIVSGRSIAAEVGGRLGPSLTLMLVAAAITILVGVPFGVLSAVHQYGRVDYALSGFTIFLVSTPPFLLGLGALYLFGVTLKVLPVGELFTFGKEDDLVDRAAHIIMPAMILGLANAALLMRYTRASMLDVLNGDYMTTARAKGLGEQDRPRPPWLAQRPHPDHHGPRAPPARADRRSGHHRDRLQLAGPRAALGPCGAGSRPRPDDGRRAHRGHLHCHGQHHRGLRLLRRRSRGSGMSAVADGLPRQVVAGQHESLRRTAIRRFLRHRLAIVGVVILTTIVAIAVFLPLLVPLDPLKTDYGAIRQPPGPGHPLGADLSGRDILARVVYGTRVSLIVGFGAVALYLVVGTTLGMIAGFSGGLRDQVIMRFTDVLLAIPLILLCIVFISIVGPGLASVIAVIGLLGWPHTTRIVRGQLLGLRESEFITASHTIGTSSSEIARRHLHAEHPRSPDGRGHVRGRPGDPARGVAVVPGPGRAPARPQPGRDDQRGHRAVDPPADAMGLVTARDRHRSPRAVGQLHR